MSKALHKSASELNVALLLKHPVEYCGLIVTILCFYSDLK